MKRRPKKLKEYNAEQARKTAAEQQEQWDKAKKNSMDGFIQNPDGSFNISDVGGLSGITTANSETGKLVGGTVTKDNAENVKSGLGSFGENINRGNYLTDEEYQAALQSAYDSYINLLNNGEDIQIVANKIEAMAAAAEYTADENAARGGSDESVRYSMQAEATEAGLDSNKVIEYSNELQKAYQLEQQIADRVALDNALMNKSIEDLTSNWEDWKAALDSADEGQRGVAINNLRKNMQQMLGTTGKLSDKWLTNADNLKLMERAAKGNGEAIDALRKSAATDLVLNIALEEDGISIAEQQLLDAIEGFDPNIKIGTTLDEAGLTDVFQGLIDSGEMTVQQVNDILEGIGFEPEISTESVTLSDKDVTNGYVEVPSGRDAYGAPTGTQRIPLQSTMEAGSTLEFPVIKGKDFGGAKYKGSAKVYQVEAVAVAAALKNQKNNIGKILMMSFVT